MNKKFLAKLLALCMVVSMLPTAAFATTGADQSNPGNNAYYTITGDVTVKSDFAKTYSAPIIKMSGSGNNLTVNGTSEKLEDLTSGSAKTFVVLEGATLNLSYVTASDAVYITGTDVTVDPTTPVMLTASDNTSAVTIADSTFKALDLKDVAVTFKGTNKMETLTTSGVTTPGSIVLKANGGAFTDGVTAMTYDQVLDVDKATKPERSGYDFKGWAEEGTETAVKEFTLGKTYEAIWEKSSGSAGTGGGGSSSSVSVKSTTGGKVTVSPSNPKKGQTVTLTPKPNAGYELVSITVKDSKGNEIEVTKNSDGTYSFTMPSGKVTITPVFEKIEGIVANFTDVKETDWFAEAVEFVTDKGIMTGVGEGRFAPQTTTSRAMLVQMLYALEGKPNAGKADFTDVASGDWFADAVAWANAKGIVTGLGDGKFGPNNDLTREQMALILYGYAQMKGYDVSKKGDMSAYADQTSISSWASEAMAWAVGAGMISGRTTTTLVPGGIATRAEMAQIMMRFCENVAK